MDTSKKVVRAWRNFLCTEEGIEGMRWILSNRPQLDEANWKRASGFEEFKKRIDELCLEDAASDPNDGSDTLKR